MELRARLSEVVAERSVLKHPFYLAWNEGTLPRETLRDYAAQYYQQVLAFPRYLSAVHSRCELAQARSQLLENLIEEERGPDNHPELWLRFCEALGLSRDEVRNAERTSATASLLEVFYGLSRRSWTEGLAALYAYESQVPEVAEAKIDGLARFYGIADARSVAFFEVHRVADVFHRSAEERLLDENVPQGGEGPVLESATAAARALWSFLDQFPVARVEGGRVN
jgi:pyrroloquinoline-quinone synthase